VVDELCAAEKRASPVAGNEAVPLRPPSGLGDEGCGRKKCKLISMVL
jgi:hypothetical protein